MPPEERFDRITRLAARLLGEPYAFVNLVDAGRLWTKSAFGVAGFSLDLDDAVCAEVVREGRPLVVADLSLDPRFKDLSTVAGPPHLRSYAGCPVRGPGDLVVGTLCVAGTRPRALPAEDLDALRDLAGTVETELAITSVAAARERLRSILDSISEPVVTLDGELRLRATNPSAEKFFGCSEKEMEGVAIERLMQSDAGTNLVAEVRTLGAVRRDATLQLPDGREVAVELSFAPVESYLEERYVCILRDVSEQKRAAEALATAQRERLAIFEDSPLGICTIGVNGGLRSANPALSGLLGVPVERLVGMTFADVTHPDDVAITRELFARVSEPGVERGSIEKRYRRLDGSVFWGNLMVSSVRDDDGQAEYFVAMVEDISKQRAARQELERLNQDKSNFVSLVSHEFRTALTGIQGFSEILGELELTPAEVREYSGDINTDAKRLNRLITDMLDLDRIESGQVTLDLEPFDLRELMEEAVSHARSVSQRHMPVFERPKQRLLIRGDRDKLAQVLANLVSNAIKYSPEGGKVTVTGRHLGSAVEVDVSDEGLGIPEDARERIFERYARLDTPDRREIKGTGLGLPIVKQIVELHGGKVSVQSRLGEGSTFRVRLPV